MAKLKDLDAIETWVRKRINMRWQCALALTYTVGNVVTEFTPERLADQCATQIWVLDHLMASPDKAYALRGVQLLAWSYHRAPGYKREWAPDELAQSV